MSPSETVALVTVSAPLGVFKVMKGLLLYSLCVNLVLVALRLLTVTVVSVAVAFKVKPPLLEFKVPA